MGLISGLLLWPLAPVKGVSWLAERLMEQAEQQQNDPDVLRATLDELEIARLNGEIDPATAAVAEDELWSRLMATGVAGWPVEEPRDG